MQTRDVRGQKNANLICESSSTKKGQILVNDRLFGWHMYIENRHIVIMKIEWSQILSYCHKNASVQDY